MEGRGEMKGKKWGRRRECSLKKFLYLTMGPAVPIAVPLPPIRRWIRASIVEIEEHKHLVFNIVMHLGGILLNFPQRVEDQICSW